MGKITEHFTQVSGCTSTKTVIVPNVFVVVLSIILHGCDKQVRRKWLEISLAYLGALAVVNLHCLSESV